jgi:hypothetical protein
MDTLAPPHACTHNQHMFLVSNFPNLEILVGKENGKNVNNKKITKNLSSQI